MSASTHVAVSPSLSSATPSLALRRYAWGVLVYNIAVILWGAAVRATGSGGGCGEHWPLCNGSVIQQHPTAATLIEYAHRATSGIALIAVLGLVFWTFRGTAKRHLARAASVAALVFTLNEALLGALLVLLGLTANNQSVTRTVYFALHLTNTLLMLAAFTLAAHFLARRRGFMRGSVEWRHPWLAIGGLAAILLTGITGALAALADTLYPATNLRVAILEDFSGHGNWLVRLRWAHPAVSILAGLFLLIVIAGGLRGTVNRKLSVGLGGLLLLQYLLGLADLTLLTPLSMQILHLLGADLVWITLVVLTARMFVPPIGCPGGICR